MSLHFESSITNQIRRLLKNDAVVPICNNSTMSVILLSLPTFCAQGGQGEESSSRQIASVTEEHHRVHWETTAWQWAGQGSHTHFFGG